MTESCEKNSKIEMTTKEALDFAMKHDKGMARPLSIIRLINKFGRINTEEAEKVVAVLQNIEEERKNMPLYEYYQEQYPSTEEEENSIFIHPDFSQIKEWFQETFLSRRN